jgi:hypothetical protein
MRALNWVNKFGVSWCDLSGDVGFRGEEDFGMGLGIPSYTGMTGGMK